MGSKIAISGANRAPIKHVDTARLRDNLAKFEDATKSAGTRRAYASQWRTFEAWCTDNRCAPLPASPGTIAAYVEQIYDDGKSPRTLTVARAAILAQHVDAGYPSPFDDAKVKALLKGVHRQMVNDGMAEKHVARTITLDELGQLADACPDTLEGIRNRALILVAFGGWMRKSDLLNMRVDGLDWHADEATVRLSKSKTSQYGASEFVSLPSIKTGKYAALCPCGALRRWLSAAGLTGKPGPVWRHIRNGVALDAALTSTDHIYVIVADLAKRAGLTGISPHRAFRASPITLAILAGGSMPEVMAQARHKSAQTTTMYFDALAAGQGKVSRSVYG